MIEREGDALRVTAAMTMENAASLLGAGTAFIDDGCTVVNLSEVPDVDSAALGLIFEWLRYAQNRNATLAFTHLPQPLISLATLYGALDLIPLKADPH